VKHRPRTARRPPPSKNGHDPLAAVVRPPLPAVERRRAGAADGHAAAPLPNGSIPAPPADRRAADGTYARGTKGGPGNPYAKRVAALKTLLLDAVESRLPKVVAALLDRAEAGDTAAVLIALKYSLGRPSPAVDVDRVTSGLDELRLLLRRPLGLELVLSAMESFPPAVAVEFLQRAAVVKTDPLTCMGGTDDDDPDDDDGATSSRLDLLAALKGEALKARVKEK
jgi:hypothetical protein